MKYINQILHYLWYLIFFLVLIFCSLLVSGKIWFEKDFLVGKISINEKKITWISLWDFQPWTGNNYTFTIKEESKNNVSDWVSFLWILTTLLAAFFIYSSRKIDNDLRKITDIKDSIKKIEENAKDEVEFSSHLKYSIHYMLLKEYDKAIDSLIVLKSEPYTIKDSRNYNVVCYFLAVCYYEDWCKKWDIEKVAKAVEFIDKAIEDSTHPLKNEYIDKFVEMSKLLN